ncbi:hypothetical protein Pan258_26030 [Symmachiella dynata]|nr:hypothetical protein [Symmachiella dynata]QDT48561.1 hypothetical protein Pan258_26030 [Symmachiella dynata]|tara:strand:+ start:1040 stop:1348 length:309 start_codon:yes stop_codon:yes gene_type:complete
MVAYSKMDADSKVDRRVSSVLNADKTGGENDGTGTSVTSAKTSRPKVERRRQIDPTTCERDYTDDEIEFMKAMDKYKRTSGRQFPTWSEVLEVVRDLGYSRD